MTRYLVVDDSRTIRLTIAAALRQSGSNPEILEADNVQAALEAFRRAAPDLVFLDMMLARDEPKAGGLSILETILSERPEAKVVLVTGLSPDHPDLREAISAGAYAHIAKPVRVEAVRQVLQTFETETGRAGRIR